MIKVGSDFSGVGAFNQALMRLGIDYEEVFACDMDKFARQTYIHNYGEPKYFPYDVYNREIPTESLDIYMTSPPCQAFSLAGKRLGVSEERGILFYNSLEFIKKNRPRYFIFENVKGLLSSEKGETFKYWLELLGGKSINKVRNFFKDEDSVDYHIHWKVLNAKKYGVPQNRERVFIIGIRDDEDNNFEFPNEVPLEKRLRDVLEENVDDKYYLSKKMLELLTYEKKGNIEIANINKGGQRGSVADENGEYIGCLTAADYKLPKLIQVKSATSKGYEEASEGDSINFVQPNSKTRRGRVGKQVAQTLDTACNQGVIIGAIRGRETENGLQQQLELGSRETSNSITTVQKDNVILIKENENKLRFYKDDYKKSGIQGMDIIKQNGIADTITSNHPGNVLVYKEFRTEEGKKKRRETGTNSFKDKEGGFFEQEYSSTITTTQKDKLIAIDNTEQIIQLNPSKESGGKQPYQQNRVYDANGINPALNAGQVTWGGNIVANKRLNETIEKHELQNGEVTLIDSYNKSIHKETSPTISTRVNASSCTHLWDGYEIRRLTPRECFRLMDFPDTFTWPVSDSQAYKQAGNSIVVNVLYKIIKNLNLKK